MPEEIIYPKSPIREAVFDVRVTFEKQPDVSSFEEAHKLFNEEYPKREISQLVSFEMKVGQDPKVNTTGSPNGLIFTSSDGKQIAQFRVDGFTFSRLEPYSEWKIFFSEAKKMLDIYLKFAKPLKINRIALRYINAIKIPTRNFRLEDYLKTLPTIGPELPQSLVQFFLRSTVFEPESGCLAIINQTVEDKKQSQDTYTVVLFDIDVFKQNLSIDLDSKEFFQNIDTIKTLRTRIFQGSLTDKAKELFN